MTLTVNPMDSSTAAEDSLLELKKHTEYLSRIDWKLWVIMNMIESIAKESGYEFEIDSGHKQTEEQPVERVRVVDQSSDLSPKYNLGDDDV